MERGGLFKKLFDLGFILVEDSFFKFTLFTFSVNDTNYTSDVLRDNLSLNLLLKRSSKTRSLKGLQWVRKVWVLCSSENLGSLSKYNNFWTKAFAIFISPIHVAITVDVITTSGQTRLWDINSKSFSAASATNIWFSWRSPTT